MVKAEVMQTWDELAKMYTSIYRAGLSKDFTDTYRVCASSLCAVLRDPPAAVESAAPPSDVDMSSVGKLLQHVPESYGPAESGLEVVDVGLERNY